MKKQGPLHVATPLRESLALTKVAGTSVYIKLESSQPTGSFKIRGIGHLCKTDCKYPGSGEGVGGKPTAATWPWFVPLDKWSERGCKRFVCCSGGNAGMAAAYSARHLSIPATIVVPSVTPPSTVQRLKDEGADVIIHGKALNESISYGEELVANNPGSVFISPFDDPLIWEGHSSLVRELEEDLKEKPGAVVLSVGGGGLMNGVVEGLRHAGWADVPVVAMETHGAHSFNAAVKAGRLVTLPEITSIATTLGLATVSAQSLKLSGEHPVFSEVVTDQDAVRAVERFLDDEKILVEPACGATLAAVYCGIIERLQGEGKLKQALGPVVVVVCGGNNISMEQLRGFKKKLGMLEQQFFITIRGPCGHALQLDAAPPPGGAASKRKKKRKKKLKKINNNK
ncbi:L-serine dehydratase/L-threonine deaminase isoform X2 [Gadus morhua]|nr:L-serine dehydratase/L-threonine deaminase-like isoform X2 [Gadus morhua]